MLRNVTKVNVEFEYKIPRTSVFCMEFPKKVSLLPGMSISLMVRFRPVSATEYTDYIEIVGPNGSFHIPVMCRIPRPGLEVPTDDRPVDVGLVSVGETGVTSFTLSNSGSLALTFRLDCPRPFRVEPAEGALAAGASMAVKAYFSPDAARVYVATVVATVPGVEGTQSFEVNGMGKYPILALSAVADAVSGGLSALALQQHQLAGESQVQLQAASSPLAPLAVDFGTAGQGSRKEKSVMLRNLGTTASSFVVRPAQPAYLGETVFAVHPTEGTLAAGAHALLKVSYAAQTPGMLSVERFVVETRAGAAGGLCALECSGFAAGPDATFDLGYLDFGDVPLGSTVVREVVLRNVSPASSHARVPASYCFACDRNGVFAIDKPAGAVGPGLATTIRISFSPLRAYNFYRRLHCLVLGGKTLRLDVMGSGVSDKARPSPFGITHVRRYLRRKARGIHLDPKVDFVPVAEDEEEAALIEDEEHRGGVEDATRLPPLERVAPSKELLAGNAFFDEVAIEDLDGPLEFGAVERGRASDARVVTVRNRTKTSMMCCWAVPGEATRAALEAVANARSAESAADSAAAAAAVSSSSSSGATPSPFQVLPAVAEIPPNGVFSFKVVFRPQADQTYYDARLEGYAFYKHQRTFRLVDLDTFVPPWCLILPVRGHSFHSASHFLPRASLHPAKITFPAASPGEDLFQTVELRNDADTPMTFRASGDSSGGVFTLAPASGFLPKGGSTLLLVRFRPRAVGPAMTHLRLHLNHHTAPGGGSSSGGGGGDASVSTFTVDLPLKGSCAGPEEVDVDVAPDGRIFFPPTSVRQAGERVVRVRNRGSLPLMWKWSSDETPGMEGVVEVVPRSGFVEGNGSVACRVFFRPRLQEAYKVRVRLETRPLWSCYQAPRGFLAMLQDQSALCPSVAPAQRTLAVMGTGAAGDVRVEPPSIDVPAVLVRTPHQVHIDIVNSSDVGMTWELRWRHYPEHQLEFASGYEEPSAGASAAAASGRLLLLEPAGPVYVPARSTQRVYITVFPSVNVMYRFKVWVAPFDRLRGALGSSDRKAALKAARASEPPSASSGLVCELKVRAQYPQLSVTDVASESVSMTRLRKQLSLRALNQELESDVSPEEEELYSAMSRDPRLVSELETFEFNFGAAPVHSEPVQIRMRFTNTGRLETRWDLLFASDLETEEEHWTDTGAPTAEEKRHARITEAGIFSVQPRSGTLAGGESCLVDFRFNTSLAGIHDLPVLLKLAAGKQVQLRFAGCAFWPSDPTLHFNTTLFNLRPVAIGDLEPPVQTFDVHNASNHACGYVCDLSAVEKLTSDCHGFAVVSVENPRGVVPGRSSVQLRLVFRPLEAREYRVEVPIAGTEGGTGRVITLVGRGFHPRQMGDVLRAEQRALAQIAWSPTIELPGQLARISQQFVVFGNIPQFSVQRQVLILENISGQPVRYAWSLHSQVAQETVRINPPSGTLGPGAKVVCKLVFLPGSRIMVFDLDMSCQVSDEADQVRLDRKRFKLLAKLAEANKVRGSGMISASASRVRVNDEDLLQPAGSTLSLYDGGRGGGGGGRAGGLRDSDDENNNFFDDAGTQQGEDADHVEGRRMARKGGRASTGLSRPDEVTMLEEKMAALGEPANCKLHVNLQARTYSVDAYRQIFGGSAPHFIPRVTIPEVDDADNSAAAWQAMLGTRGAFFSDLVATMVREITYDPDVMAVLTNPAEEPIPVYAAVSTNPLFERYREAGPGFERSSPDMLAGGLDASLDPAEASREAYDLGPEGESEENAGDGGGMEGDGDGREVEFEVTDVMDPEPVAAAAEEAAGVRSTKRHPARGAYQPDPRVVRRLAKEDRLKQTVALMQRADFEETVDYILESSVFNIISESIFGEFSFAAPPRNIVPAGLAKITPLPPPKTAEELQAEAEAEEERKALESKPARTGRTFGHVTKPSTIKRK